MGRMRAFSTVAALAACVLLVCTFNPALAGKKKREKHAENWPCGDLSPYAILYVEEFGMKDPKADSRKKQVQVKSAPKRLADYIVDSIDSGLFDEVRRGTPDEPTPGAVILRGDFTQYKPGSAFGRAMLAGVGSAHLDFVVHLINSETGETVVTFDSSRTWAWGGMYGMTKGVGDIEQNVAYELTLYLKRCKTGEVPAEE